MDAMDKMSEALATANREIDRLRGLLATGAGCEEGYRLHYVGLLNKVDAQRIASVAMAEKCESRMFRYGEEAKKLRDVLEWFRDFYIGVIHDADHDRKAHRKISEVLSD